jgi:transposase
MPVPLSMDLRKRIIEAKKRGDTEVKISIEKAVSQSVVTKLWSLYRTTGSYAPRPNPCGRKPALSPEQFEQVRETVCQQPDITLRELKDEFHLPVSISALSAMIRTKLGFRFKKKRFTPLSKNVRT